MYIVYISISPIFLSVQRTLSRAADLIYSSVAEPEPVPVEPKLFETWRWNRSQNFLFNKYLLLSVWRMLG